MIVSEKNCRSADSIDEFFFFLTFDLLLALSDRSCTQLTRILKTVCLCLWFYKSVHAAIHHGYIAKGLTAIGLQISAVWPRSVISCDKERTCKKDDRLRENVTCGLSNRVFQLWDFEQKVVFLSCVILVNSAFSARGFPFNRLSSSTTLNYPCLVL